MSKDKTGSLIFEGIITGIQKTYYAIKILNSPAMEDKEVRGFLSGKMKMNKIKVIIGDVVVVELDSYDLTKGRITYRKK
jgi:translation initiation factor IF-1